MLAKKNRLPIHKALERRGEMVRKPAFTVKIFRAEFPYSRFGVVVGRRVGKTAVLRNAIRRRVFTAIEGERSMWPVADYLIIIYPAAAHYTAQKWHEEFIQFSTIRPSS